LYWIFSKVFACPHPHPPKKKKKKKGKKRKETISHLVRFLEKHGAGSKKELKCPDLAFFLKHRINRIHEPL
jgi:hypothetical protein